MKNNIFLSIGLFLGIIFSLQAQVSGTPYIFGNNNTIANAVCDGTSPTTVVEITSMTGRVWMDRNLGASRAAISSTDYAAYGCLYQWGRGNDGHANINWTSSSSGSAVNGITTILSSSDNPGNSLYISNSAYPYDWRSPQNVTLWQGVASVNNPCNSGFHVPSDAEFLAEIDAYSLFNASLAYANGPSGGFKFVLPGKLLNGNSTINTGSQGTYWTSTTGPVGSGYRKFDTNSMYNSNDIRVSGYSVRCIKDAVPNAPTAVSAVVGEAQATVSFTAPTFEGDAPITGYTVTSSPGGLSVSGSSSPLTVTGLIGTSYTFTVVATNSVGNSQASLPSNSVTPYTGSAICDGSRPTTVVDITTSTGKIWMDRNLGASRAATSSTDYAAYGCLYQWGRGNDGHASINWASSTTGTTVNGSTTTLATTDIPGHSLLIKAADWRSPISVALWQGAGGINNPCNTGYHVPTSAEFLAEFTAYSITNTTTAYNSPFKFPFAGYWYNDVVVSNGVFYLWSSTTSGPLILTRKSDTEVLYSGGMGFSVRCIKDDGKPGAPIAVVAVAGDAQATVSFTPPTLEGNTPITGYTVTSSPGGLSVSGSSSPLTVTGLTLGTPYTFTVVATNSIGNSQVSLPSNPITSYIGAICDGSKPTTVVDITTSTGKIWMDRNLGAIRAAISDTDYMAYGCLYQWGRGNDGHANINWTSSTLGTPINGTTTTLATTDVPGNGLFIVSSVLDDWRSTINNELWQGVGSINNPCPSGYHIPTASEFSAEVNNYSASNHITNFDTAGKLVFAGERGFSYGTMYNAGGSRFYWSSTVSGTSVYTNEFRSDGYFGYYSHRGRGASVRCMKDDYSPQPVLLTTKVSSILDTQAIGEGNVRSIGGSAITARGVCWSTSSLPTIADNKTIETGTTGIFSSNITGLLENTTYYLRAYATNSLGTGYGQEVSFTTNYTNLPSLTTTAVSSTTYSSTTSGGYVINTGSGAITARGVCWSITPLPTIADNKTTETGTTGVFSSSITGLSGATEYYVRAYATNSFGTGYGPQIKFGTAIDAICDGSQPTGVVDITSSTGKIWMDRDLGASRAATSATDYYAYGCYYQWGRGNDGHASIAHTSSNSAMVINGSTTTQSTTDTPGNNLFITGSLDWRTPPNYALWQGANGVNNPCPSGYRVPSGPEFTSEITAYASNGATGAFTTIQKFVLAGIRHVNNVGNISVRGLYWNSSTNGLGGVGVYDVSSPNANASSGTLYTATTSYGISVRCIKD